LQIVVEVNGQDVEDAAGDGEGDEGEEEFVGGFLGEGSFVGGG